MVYFSHLRIVTIPTKSPIWRFHFFFLFFIFLYCIMCHKSIARSLNDNHEPPWNLEDF